MTNVLLIVVYFGILLALTKPLGLYMDRLFSGERAFLSPVLGRSSAGSTALTGVDETQEMRWTTYTVALLLFNLAGLLVVYLLQRFQGGLPLQPAGSGRRRAAARPSTPPSRSRPTPTGRATTPRSR